MQKLKGMILYWLAAVVLGCGIVAFTYINVNAEEIKSGEAYFTHTHIETCNGMVTKTCSGQHSHRYGTEYKEGHCFGCSTWVSLLHTADTYTCQESGVQWQENGTVTCTNCGNICSRWGAPQGRHTYQAKELVCGREQDEQTAAVSITADDSWTNTGVMLMAHIEKLKDDSINGEIALDWSENTLYAEENGTYTVTATNSAGQTVSTSITVSCIDKISPVIETTQGDTGSMSKNEIRVFVAAADYESGLDGEAYSADGGTTWTGNNSFLVREGAPLHLAVRDKAGNMAQKTLQRKDFPYPPEPPKPTEPPKPSESQRPTGTQKPAGTQKSANPQESFIPQKTTETKGTAEPQVSAELRTSAKTQNSAKSASDFTIARIPEAPNGDNNTGLMKETAEAGERRQKQADMATAEEKEAGADANMQKAQIEQALFIAGAVLLLTGVFLLLRLLWLHSVVLYGYNGGENYKRLALLHLKKEKGQFFLYLPEYLLEGSRMPRYRLVLRQALIKKA